MNDEQFERELRDAAKSVAGGPAPRALHDRVSAIPREIPRIPRRTIWPPRLLGAVAAFASIAVLVGMTALIVGTRPHETVTPGPTDNQRPEQSQAPVPATLHLTIVTDPRPLSDYLTTGLQLVPAKQWARLTASDGHVAARWQPGIDPDPTVPAGTYEFEAWPTYRDDWAEGGTSWRDMGDRPIGEVTLAPGTTSLALHLTAGWHRPWSVQPGGTVSLTPEPDVPLRNIAAAYDPMIAATIDVLHAEEALVGRVTAPIAIQSVNEMSADEALRTAPELESISLASSWPAVVWVVRAQGTFGAAGPTSGYLVFSNADGRLLGMGATGSAPWNGPQASPFPITLSLAGGTVSIVSPAGCDTLGGSKYYLRFCRALASPSDWRSITSATTNDRLVQTPELMARVTRAYLADDGSICDDPLVLRLVGPAPVPPDPSASPEPSSEGCRRSLAATVVQGYVEIMDPTTTNNSAPLRVLIPVRPPESPSPSPQQTPSQADVAGAKQAVETYTADLVRGDYAGAWALLAPETRTHWGSIEAFTYDRRAYFRSVAGRYTVVTWPSDVGPIANWLPNTYGGSVDLRHAVLVEVDYAAMAGNNAGYSVYIVAPGGKGLVVYDVR